MSSQVSDDGWTHVPSKGRRKPAPSIQPNSLNPPSRDLTLPKLQQDFDTKLKTWKASVCRKTLLQLLDRVRPEDGWSIGQAICLASGSFSRDNVECRRRSMWQIVVFVDLVAYLCADKDEDTSSVKTVAQEPMYTQLDVEFLDKLNIQALQIDTANTTGMGAAKAFMCGTTFVFEPFLDMTAAMLEEVIAADLPLYIGSSIRGLREKTTPAGQLAKQFAQERGKYKFPAFEVDPNVMDGLEIFWEEESDED